MKRRTFIGHSAKTAMVTALAGSTIEAWSSPNATVANDPGLTQSPLSFAYSALEPSIDARTMEIHYSRHAAGYAKNMADAIAAEHATGKSLREMLQHISKYSTTMRNNAGGHFNHEKFWQWMAPGGTKPSSALVDAIQKKFGGMDAMQKQFAEAATKRFGSGWAWLIVDAKKQLSIGSTPNQDNPLMDISDVKGEPILGIDVWEHAYYLKYQNKRGDYVGAWWNVVNWEAVSLDFQAALQA